MKQFFVINFIAAILAAAPSHAEILKYRLYEDSVEDFTPYVLTLETEGGFQSGAKIVSMKLDRQTDAGLTPLFTWSPNQIAKLIKYSWDSKGTLSLKQGKDSPIFKSIVKKSIRNPWGDTEINPHDDYSLYIDREILLDRNGTLNETRFEISNETQGESCLWGILKK